MILDLLPAEPKMWFSSIHTPEHWKICSLRNSQVTKADIREIQEQLAATANIPGITFVSENWFDYADFYTNP